MVVPLHYVHGIMQLLVHALIGATVHCCTSFIFPGKIVKLLQEHAITGFSGVPYHFNALVARGGLLSAELPALRWLTVTGGKLASSRVLGIVETLPNVDFHIAYGQTECAPRATSLDPAKIRRKPDSIGAAIPRVSVTLVDEDGRLVPQGSVGEVVVEGANVMQGYWRDPEGTAEVLDDNGRLHTGDLGRFDADGDLYLVGRISAMIKSAGERIFPEELERILTVHECVEEAVVVGVTDELYGQRVVAHLLVSAHCVGDTSEQLVDAVREFCLSKVPLARAPREFTLWQTFPTKANGKPDRLKISEGKDCDEQRYTK
jgi:acyl-CoA synthetase (AMP-forming)/AMP-acid ligase II